MSNFMGKNGFNWFVGVVEDRTDPQTLGRLRVRCLGYHTEGLDKLPTDKLPWAHVMNPVTSATVSGLGQSPLGAVEGTWVIGFFQDGEDAQQPIIIGTLPGVPSELPDTGSKKGFMDTSGNYPKYKNETDVNRLAVNDTDLPHSSLTIRKADRTTDMGRADFDSVELGVANSRTGSITLDADDGTAFDEPEAPYASVYPHNHVYESEAGHIREMDDTAGAERIHERHASGSGYEIHPDGSKVTRVKNDNYTLTTGDDFAHIKGNSSTTVDGGVRVFVNADGSTDDHNYTIQVGNNANVNIQVDKGNVNVVTSEGDINLKSGKNIQLDATQGIFMTARTFSAEISSTWVERVQGNNLKTGDHIQIKGNRITATGDPINLN